MIAEHGYYSTVDGRNVILVPDLISDRATGEILMMTHVVSLNMTHQQIGHDYRISQLGGAAYNGIIEFNIDQPAAEDDFVSTFVNQGVLIDVLANDSHPSDGILWIAEATDPINGNAFIRDNKILYQPNYDFSGIDTFAYWAVDETGSHSRAFVTVEVWDL